MGPAAPQLYITRPLLSPAPDFDTTSTLPSAPSVVAVAVVVCTVPAGVSQPPSVAAVTSPRTAHTRAGDPFRASVDTSASDCPMEYIESNQEARWDFPTRQARAGQLNVDVEVGWLVVRFACCAAFDYYEMRRLSQS